jgi:hypothetical protein
LSSISLPFKVCNLSILFSINFLFLSESICCKPPFCSSFSVDHRAES